MVPTRGQPNDQIQAEIVAPVFQGQLSPVQDGFNPLLLEASLDDLLQGLLDDLRHFVLVIDVHALDADAESAVTRVVVVPSRWRKAGAEQVWSLTQFYSVDFLQSSIGVKSAFSTNTQSRVASVVVDGVLGPPRLARHT